MSTTAPNILVTGGSRGIGRAICEQLYKKGCNVIFTYRSSQAAAEELIASLQALGQPNRVAAYQCDMASMEAVTELFKTLKKDFGQLDGLVNNAGQLGETKPFMFANDEGWFETLRHNVACVTNSCKRVLPLMIRKKQGRILNITSIAARLGNPGQSAYAASKAAIVAFSKSLFREISAFGITVNCLSPGLVATDMTSNLNKRYVDEILKTPLGRFARPDEVASVAAFLMTDAPDYLLGQDVVLDGGLGV